MKVLSCSVHKGPQILNEVSISRILLMICITVYRNTWLQNSKYLISDLIVNRNLDYLKGSPNFQGILDWIVQILHYYCRKQRKSIKSLWIVKQNLVHYLPSSLFTATCVSHCHPQRQSFWTQYFANFKRHKWSFLLYIVSFSGLKMIFS